MPGEVIISMAKYIDNILVDIPSEMKWDAKTPAIVHLFDVPKDPYASTKPQTWDDLKIPSCEVFFSHIVTKQDFVKWSSNLLHHMK